MSQPDRAQNQEFLDNMNKKFRVTNISKTAKVSLLADEGVKAEKVDLRPGEDTEMTAYQMAHVYSHSVNVMSDGRKNNQRITILPLEDKKVAAPSDAETKGETDDLIPTEDGQDAITVDAKAVKKEIKSLEAEYKADGTPLERKQKIKEEIRVKRLSLRASK